MGEDMLSKLTESQEEHIARISTSFSNKLRRKYTKGAAEHGGDIRDIGALDLLDMAIEECLDMFVYLESLKEVFLNKGLTRVGIHEVNRIVQEDVETEITIRDPINQFDRNQE